ncbi:hypothetical protein GGI12_003292 [Dipsacomyces acuminosporus]|nr:hypothetical protein GGI12_003292 [Dipsacomyces acuminosporus]
MALPEIDSFKILETTLYKHAAGVWLVDSHVERMKASAVLLRAEYNSPTSFPCSHISTGLITEKVKTQIADADSNYRPTDTDSVFVRCKTTHRRVYADAAERVPAQYRKPATQVLLYNTRNEITEGNIANVAIGVPDEGDPSAFTFVTPPLHCGLLPGTVRADLVKKGEVVERTVTVDQFKEAVRNGWPVKCMNSVRGFYSVSPLVLENV